MGHALVRWVRLTFRLAGKAGVLAILIAVLHPAPAEACGNRMKLIIPLKPHKPVAPSLAPAHVLVVGSPPRRLVRNLRTAGHDAEDVATASQATRASYAVVIVDSDGDIADARARFDGATVVVRSGDVDFDMAVVEDAVIGRRLRLDAARALGATIFARAPFVATPDQAPARSGAAAALVAVLAALGLAVLTRSRASSAAS